MKRRFCCRAWTLAPLLVLIPPVLMGQAHPDSVKRQDCRLAAQILETGHPAPHADWAWQHIVFCSPSLQVRTLAAAMERARTTDDVDAVKRALLPAIWIRDRTVFDKLVGIAEDKNASVPARVVAFVALAALRDPWSLPSYERFIGGVDEYPWGVVVPRTSCSARIAHPREPRQGITDLPVDYAERISELGLRVSRDPTEPQDVRSAAACV